MAWEWRIIALRPRRCALDHDEGKTQEMLRFFCRHLVALSVTFERPDGTHGAEACSGFVISVRGRWFLVTAGHILIELFEHLPKCKNVVCDLYDAWQEGASQIGIPFPLLDSEHVEVDEHDGLDVGLVKISEHHQRLLERNNIRAFDEHAWRDPPADMAAYRLLGIPDELIKRTDGARRIQGVRVAFLHAAKVDPPPQMKVPVPCFYGKLAPQIVDRDSGMSLDSIKGLSGGPIFGFKEDGRYWVVAVQSMWDRALRVIRGPLMSEIGVGLDAFLFPPKA